MEAIVLPQSLADDLSSRLAQYHALTGAITLSGLAGQDAINAAVAGLPGADVFELDAEPDNVFLDSPDGHPPHALPHVPKLFPGRCVGRLTFAGLNAVDAVTAYRNYFDRLIAYYTVGPQEPLLVRIYDNFSNVQPAIGQQVRKEFSALPPRLIDYHDAAEISQYSPYGPGPALMSGPSLFHIDLSGGMGSGWLWQEGQETDYIAHPIDASFAGVFGSYISDSQQADSIFRAIMTWALIGVYDWYGNYPWHQVLAGATFGQAALALGQGWTGLMGSPSLRLPKEVIDAVSLLAPMQSQIDTLTSQMGNLAARLAKLETAGPAPVVPPISGPAPIVVTKALYRVRDYPTVDNEGQKVAAPGSTLAYVRAQIAAGKPVAALDALYGDPWPGQEKQLYIEGSGGSVTWPVIIAEPNSMVIQ